MANGLKTDTNITDKESTHQAHVSHFGVLKAASTIPVLKGNFPGSVINTDIWTETTVNSATATVSGGLCTLASGTNSAGSTKLVSSKTGRFEAGQVTVWQSGVYAGTAQASNKRKWGMITVDEQNGLYFQWDGTAFQVVALKGGVEVVVEQDDFNRTDAFQPGNSNNTYRIEYSAGRALFYAASKGKKRLLHEMVNTQTPLVNNLKMGGFYENTNDGNTTSVSMLIRGFSISVWGDLRRFNESGSQYVTEEGTEIALGNVEQRKLITVFGRNPDIDTGPEDIWNGGGVYTGQPAAFTPETVAVVSSSAADTSAGTGARTIMIEGLKTSASTKYETETLTMNGTTTVTSTSSWYRVVHAEVLTGGSGAANAGIITVNSSTTTANVFLAMPVGYNSSNIAAWTVPASSRAVIKRVRVGITRANGSAGSANITMRYRTVGGVYVALRSFEVATQQSTEFENIGGTVLEEGTDILFRVESVSDTNTIAEAAIEIILIEE